jgi:hypothetical protein
MTPLWIRRQYGGAQFDGEAPRARRLHRRFLMHVVTVTGAFDTPAEAEEAKKALLSAGVPEGRIAVDVSESGACVLGVQAHSSFERARIKELLQRSGASLTRPA